MTWKHKQTLCERRKCKENEPNFELRSTWLWMPCTHAEHSKTLYNITPNVLIAFVFHVLNLLVVHTNPILYQYFSGYSEAGVRI